MQPTRAHSDEGRQQKKTTFELIKICEFVFLISSDCALTQIKNEDALIPSFKFIHRLKKVREKREKKGFKM